MSTNLDAIWYQTLENLKNSDEISSFTFKEILEPTTLHKLDNEYAYVVLEDAIAVATAKQFKTTIESYLQEVASSNYKIKFITEDDIEHIGSSVIIEEATPSYIDDLNKEYRFDNFVVGTNNRVARRASSAVASAPGTAYNPLFIYGNPGMGKTHLVTAIGNQIKSDKPNMRPLYVSSNTLINDFQKLISKKETDKIYDQNWFDHKYQNIDLLIIDDIQMLKSKEKTTESFFNIYNNLYEKNKQIVITSDVSPGELDGMTDRMISRFSQGLTVRIDPLDVETSIQILRSKLEYHQKTDLGRDCAADIITDEALEYIANNFSKDVRGLEGALTTIMLLCIDINAESFSMDFVKSALGNIEPIAVDKIINKDDILNTISKYYNLNKKDIIGKSRLKALVTPRHIAFYLCRTLLDMPFEKIGDCYGNRDHSTIMSGYNKIKKFIDTNDAEYIGAIEDIKELLKT
ncbi:chromosomal replication initiator protein DnaA [Mycoplasma sp. P36-A1]|uniref:chromosomal replication initiator protein DnaA n=1 Tax=Mycoplasma sp. P36-A1 TaxID=3252900 RepID=UPI003C2DB11C